MSGATIALIVIVAFVVLLGGGCLTCFCIGAAAVNDKTAQTKGGDHGGSPAESAVSVQATELLADYKANEVRADGKWKGKMVKVTGFVSEIKKDFTDSSYVNVGTGAEIEIPIVQCSLKSGQESAAGNLSKGQPVSVKGRVKGLILFSVDLEDCEILKAPAAPAAAPQPAMPSKAPAPAPSPKKK
jgi:hypothetical protein